MTVCSKLILYIWDNLGNQVRMRTPSIKWTTLLITLTKVYWILKLVNTLFIIYWKIKVYPAGWWPEKSSCNCWSKTSLLPLLNSSVLPVCLLQPRECRRVLVMATEVYKASPEQIWDDSVWALWVFVYIDTPLPKIWHWCI